MRHRLASCATRPFPPPGRRPSAGPRRLASLSATAALVVGACGATATDDASSPLGSASPATSAAASPSPTAPSTSAPSTEANREGEVVDAYMAAREAFSASLVDPDPDDPELAATHVDPMLAEVRRMNAEWRGSGRAGRFPDDSIARAVPMSIEVTGDAATVEICGVDDSIVYETATGTVLDDSVVTVHSSSTLRLVEGTWKLATRTEFARWEGVTECDAVS